MSDYKSFLPHEQIDLVHRIEALEAENADLRARIDALTSYEPDMNQRINSLAKKKGAQVDIVEGNNMTEDLGKWQKKSLNDYQEACGE